ncbi:response regulator transcription factor [Kitasatospora acidiphila]|uniref:Response regulator transcription factor n=1 Tax=Kitasatospora acidiphila TaxID=2567942 RepID=A0A540W7D7_9ACTN|nr:response regulator transcription factor [Kitasatospora acidiphila]
MGTSRVRSGRTEVSGPALRAGTTSQARAPHVPPTWGRSPVPSRPCGHQRIRRECSVGGFSEVARTINLFILSDDPVALAGLEAIVEQDEQVSLIGRAMPRCDAFRCLERSASRPHVVILGEPASARTVFEDVQRIVAAYRGEESRPRIIVVSQNDDDDRIVAALRVGVHGYLTRVGSPEELLQSIRLVASGGAAFCPTVAARLSRYVSSVRNPPAPTGLADLTDREREILGLIADGLGNQQIAHRLFLAEKTVRNYVSRIFTKLDVHDRTAVAVQARDAGLGAVGLGARVR